MGRHLSILAMVMSASGLFGCIHSAAVEDPASPEVTRRTRTPSRAGAADVVTPQNGIAAVSIRNVRLEPRAEMDTLPASNLVFDLQNTSGQSVTDIELSVRVLSTTSQKKAVLAGPYTIRSKAVLGPGFNMKLELALRNISSDCACNAIVEVVSARVM